MPCKKEGEREMRRQREVRRQDDTRWRLTGGVGRAMGGTAGSRTREHGRSFMAFRAPFRRQPCKQAALSPRRSHRPRPPPAPQVSSASPHCCEARGHVPGHKLMLAARMLGAKHAVALCLCCVALCVAICRMLMPLPCGLPCPSALCRPTRLVRERVSAHCSCAVFVCGDLCCGAAACKHPLHLHDQISLVIYMPR